MDIREIRVNTDTLQSDINEMRNQLKFLQQRTKGMEDNVAALNAMWEGSAHEAFSREFQRDCTDMKELLETVGGLIEHMQFADREYVSCENAIHSIVNTINI